MFKKELCAVVITCLVCRTYIAEGSKLPEILLMDDSSREILFLDVYKRLSALEARTQMSDAVDWTQQTQFDTLKTLAENQQKWLKDLEALVTPMGKCDKPVSSKKAAFSAYLDHDINTGNGTNQVIKFNQVILNEGGFYDPVTGIFTCPWDGVYDLSFFIGLRGTEKSPGAWVKLYVNDKELVMAVVDAHHNYQDLQAGNRVITRLTTGDIVKVVTVDYSGFHVEGTSHRSTTFSGMFLFD